MLTPLKKGLLATLGVLSLLAGVIGIFLPLMPTVPFVLLAGFCFARSSEKLHGLLLSNPHFGTIIKNYEAGLGIPRRIKVRAILMLWAGLGISMWIVGRLELCLLLVLIGLAVSWYLWVLPEY